LAPLPEQARVAEKLDALFARVDACRDRFDRLLDILRRLRQSVLHAATTGELSREWRVQHRVDDDWTQARFDSLLTDVRYGTSKKCTYEPRRTPVLRIPNVVNGSISHDDMKYADFDDAERARLALLPGDLLMIRSNGSIGLVGRTAPVTERESGFLYAGYLIRLRVNRSRVLQEFLSLFLASPTSRARIEKMSRSTTGVNNINADEIRNLPISVPGIDEQAEIARRVADLFRLADRLERRVETAQSLVKNTTASALARAFRGSLVPQNPGDEPADKLLRRVRQHVADAGKATDRATAHRVRPRKEANKLGKKLQEVLAEEGDWIDAQDAFERCGVADGASTEFIEGLYAELRELDLDRRLAVEPVMDSQGRKTHDRLKLVARA